MPSICYYQKKYVPIEEAKVGVTTHALHYGSAIFEGIRGNWNADKKQIYVFRMKEHYQRMRDGCRLMQMNLPHNVDELCEITCEVVRKCGFREDIYIRPLAFKNSNVLSQALGVRLHNLDTEFIVFAIPWGRYLDMDKCRCGVSSWMRPADNMIPPGVKVAGIYVNNALAKTEAIQNGFDEAIMLGSDGHVAEGSGENIFLVIKGKLVTPAIYNCILNGITRDTVITLARNEFGLDVIERPIDRGELYTADECFLTGTAAHLSPVSEIDHRLVGDGQIGPVTKKLQDRYAQVIRGHDPKYLAWCTPCL